MTYTKSVLRAVLATLAFTAPAACWAADNAAPAKAKFLAPRAFSWKSLAEPENLFWPGYFWGYGGRWNAAGFRRQLEDMVAHDARSICVIPNGEFDPQANMDPKQSDYLSPKFFARVKYAVDQAARLGMNYWFYDEPGFPSGQAGGQVVRYNPAAVGHRLALDGQGKWIPRDGARVDYLDPKATDTFIDITHKRYAEAVGAHFGKTIKLIFTDEPAFLRVHPGGDLPWTAGAADIFHDWFGYSIMDKLAAFRTADTTKLLPAEKKVRVDLYDFWTRRFRDAYFGRLRDWSREHGLAFGGHLDGDDMTFGIMIEGLGHVLRPLRSMDVPGCDVIERQLFPGKPNHHFPKYASSAAHQNGTALVLTESFGVYGTGLTPAQKKWLIDYQYVRGMTVLVSCAGGPGEVLWDLSPHFHRYVARLGYVLACGRPDIETALYYPARDIWASDDGEDPALLGHDALARALTRRQCDFDLVDEDGLCDPSAHVADGRLVVGAMRYRTIVVGPTHWMTPKAQANLEALRAAGGQVIHADDLDKIDAAVARLKPTMQLDPPSPDLRVVVRRWPGGGAAFLVNENQRVYRGTAAVDLGDKLREIDPATGAVRPIALARLSGGRATVPINLAGGESLLLVSCSPNESAHLTAPVASKVVQSVELADGWTARVDRQWGGGAGLASKAEFKATVPNRWAAMPGLGEDFSGRVIYRRTVSVPESWHGGRLTLDLGRVEYAARVLVDGHEVGCVLWSPWRIELPSLGGRREFVLEIQVTNTLANENTSARARKAWSKGEVAGRRDFYRRREVRFEMESRGGGLLGPVRLQLATP